MSHPGTSTDLIDRAAATAETAAGPHGEEPIHITGNELFISVDVETSGPDAERYSLLAIGACLAFEPERGFYVELRPTHLVAVESALAVSRLSMAELSESGVPPAAAMRQFDEWLRSVILPGQRLVFVAFNAPFDWLFVHTYFHRYLGHNPFGHSALDLKALYMGLTGAPWSQTSMPHVARRYREGRPLTHHALADARDQAQLLRGMLREARAHQWPWLVQDGVG